MEKESALARINNLAYRLLAGAELVGALQEALEHGDSKQSDYASAAYAVYSYLHNLSDNLMDFADNFTNFQNGGAA